MLVRSVSGGGTGVSGGFEGLLEETVLLVDDDAALLEVMSIVLSSEGYRVVTAMDGQEALKEVGREKLDLVILDIMLPKMSGFEVLKKIREKSDVPVVMLTAKSQSVDKVVGLELGADDYITKPFSLREFRSRVRAALRRAAMGRSGDAVADDEPLEVGDLRIDFAKRSVRARGEEVQLTFVEFEILGALARNPGRVFTRELLLTRIWGDSSYRDLRTIDVHIRHLREKVERDPKHPEYLLTVRGVGYRFRDG